MKLCESCRYRNNVEQLKPCIIYRDDCKHYEKERGDMADDLISREWLKTAIHNFYYGLKHTPTEEDIQAYIDVAPSVNPQEPKTGHWTHDGSHWKNRFICSECGYKLFEEQTNYCPNCGRHMIEPQESDNCNQFSQG